MSSKNFNIVLAIETSCDDTSVALVDKNANVIGMKSRNQDEIHAPFGGVIPELACRNHTLRLLPLLDALLLETGVAWSQIDGIAVTSKPGLIGSLLVGITTAKTLALLHGLPIIGVNHLEGHLHAPLLKAKDHEPPGDFNYPYLGLCVSGGHTSLYHVKSLGKYVVLGATLDDAAGEAFDKFGKLLGLGYPAGHLVDSMAKNGNPRAFRFPKPMMKRGEMNFSFSGLKTAGRVTIEGLGVLSDRVKADLCASYQETIVDVLVEKLQRAAHFTGLRRAVITGGVSCNSRLRQSALQWSMENQIRLLIAPPRFCTDNAAMIGLVGVRRFMKGERSRLTLGPEAFLQHGELV